MPQDAFTLKYVAKELNNKLVGGKISRINQPEKDVLHLLIYTRYGTVKLTCDLSAKFCRLSLGEKLELPNPDIAPNFLMLLRKHLQNAEITDVECVKGERIIYFDFLCFSEFKTTTMRLYFEIMGKYSNAILTEEGIIVGALKTASLETGAKRVTLSGAKYIPPFKQDKAAQDDLEGIAAAIENYEGDMAKAVSGRIAGVAYSTAADMVLKYGESLTPQDVYNYLNDEKYCPCVEFTDGEPTDFKARQTPTSRPRESLLEAQSEFYDYAVGKKKFADMQRKLTSALSSAEKKVEKRLVGIVEKLAECQKADEVKLCGELITANMYALERGMTEFWAVNYYDENGGKIKILLDARLSPSQNAQKYYKKYAKLKRTQQNLDVQKAELDERAAYLKTIFSNISAAESPLDLKETEEELISLDILPPPPKPKGKQKKGAPPKRQYRKFMCDGFCVVCGRNNVQNDDLTKGLRGDDLWLHAKAYHSAHAAVLCEGKTPTDEVVKFAAEVCAYYSDARQNGKVPVDYTFKKYVKKPKGANAGFVNYTDFKTILVAPNAHKEERCDE